MKKEGFENQIHRGEVEGKRDKGRQHISDIESFNGWRNSVCERWCKQKFNKSHNVQEIVECHNRQCPEGTQHIEEYF